MTTEAKTTVSVTIQQGKGAAKTYQLESRGIKGKHEQYELYAASAGNPDISNWGGLFLTRKPAAEAKPAKTAKK